MTQHALTTTKILPPDAFLADDDETLGGADLLLFNGKTGEWSHARDQIELPIGTEVVAIVDQGMRGFVRFDDGTPRHRLLPIWPTPDLHALRQQLGDLDPALWLERDAKNNPQDPWRPARQVPVILLKTLDCLVYSTSSFGGVVAVSQLNRAVQAARRDPTNMDALPIVALDAKSYTHPTKSFGKIFSPVLDVVDWTTHAEVEAAMRRGAFKLTSADDAEPEPAERKAQAQDPRPRRVANAKPRR